MAEVYGVRFLSTDSEMSPDLQSICGNGKRFLATTVPKMIFLTPITKVEQDRF